MKKKRSVTVVRDLDENRIVLINDIIFKGKRSITWDDVKEYLRQFVGEFYAIADTKEIVYIGADMPDEYTGSRYTYKLKGTVAKAKANAAQGIPEMIEIATDKRFTENKNKRHRKDAKYGWYRYDSRFALPAYNGDEVERYNIFKATMIIRHDKNGKLYLYDVLNIKKETGNSLHP